LKNIIGEGMKINNNVMYCDICRKTGLDIAGKTKFATGKKKYKRETVDLIGLFLVKYFECRFSFLLIVVTCKR
jgi:hypothetical protein